MGDIIDAFIRVLPRGKRSATGFINFNCPACNDKRGRGGFALTPTGGFRYYCFNGGCEYQIHPTGWEPGAGLGGRPERLFEMLGGDIHDIPFQALLRTANRYDSSGEIIGREELEAVYDFPEVALPKGSDFLVDAKGGDAEAVREYVRKRGDFFLDEYDFIWSPLYPRRIIIPCMVKGAKIVGWTARAIDRRQHMAHIKCPDFPADYLFNQHRVNNRAMTRILVFEDAFDAIALDGVATFGPKLTPKQVNLLRLTGKDIVLVPDLKRGEWQSYFETARANYWYLALPFWPGDGNYTSFDHIKDAGESIRKNGRLATIETIMASIMNDYELGLLRLSTLSQGG